MKNLLIRLATIGSVAAIAIAATGAFFSDTETSIGNSLVAGALDLKVDNTCYYNGQACISGSWGGVPENGSCSCTWTQKDLEEGDMFFDLTDLKPGDWEEDTISLHITNNDAWVCADLDITQDIDNGCTEPETEDGDLQCPLPVPTPPASPHPGGDGELAEELNFIFWADDGDNVYEVGEDRLHAGPASEVLGGAKWTLADSGNNPFEEGPLKGSKDYFVGKAFCYGALTESPIPQDPALDNTPAQDNNGDLVIDSLDGGFGCDGSQVNNVSQTDLLSGNVVFEAVQGRHNDNFLCNPLPTATPAATPLASPLVSPSPLPSAS
ncbi:MAG: hypothetical protein AAB874_07795 [Patescibacteria group bacterium]